MSTRKMEFRQAFDPLRALGSAWKLMLRAPLTLILGGILLAITEADLQNGMRFSLDEDADPRVLLGLGGLAAIACCAYLLVWILNCLLHLGFAHGVQRVMVTGKERFSDLVRPRELWFSMVVARLLKTVLCILAILPGIFVVGGPIALGAALDITGAGVLMGVLCGLAYLPIWVFILLGLTLVEQVVAVEGSDPIQALRRSWDVARGNRIQLLLYSIVTGIVAASGLLVCCVGVVFTMAWTQTAWYESYIRMTVPQPEGSMWIDEGD